MSTAPAAASYETTLSAFGNNTGIVVPAEVIDALGAGKRPPVDAVINGHRFRTTIGTMQGRAMISVSAALRRETGLEAGDAVRVELTVDETPREIEIPDDFMSALRANRVEPFFAGLSNSLQRYHIDLINGAKADETRRRRIDKAVTLFIAGKKR